MEFSAINGFNTEFNLNAVKDYNKFLQRQASFDFETESLSFSTALDKASKSAPLKDKNDPIGLGNFAQQIGASLGSG